MSKILYKIEINLKGLLHTLIQILCVFAFAYFNDCIFEMALIYACFFIFRGTFEKQYHAKTTWLCTLYTIIVFYIVSNIAPNKSISVILIVAFTYIINLISFFVRDYLDLINSYKVKKFEITKGMSKDKLNEICLKFELNELETKILTYFYCERLSLTAISYKIGYSYDNTYLLKKKALNKILKNT